MFLFKMVFARSRKVRSSTKRRGKTYKHKYTLKGGDKEKACNQFFQGMNGFRHYDPEVMSLGQHTNLEEKDYTSWLTFIPTLNKDNLLLIVVGDQYDTSIKYRSRNILKTHNINNDEFIKSWKGKITVLILDLENRIDGEIEKSDLDLGGLDDKVEKVFIKQLMFPFTPIPSMTKAPPSPVYGRSPFPYSILVLNELINYPSPIFITSRMNNMCFRSFKYIIDMRKIKGLQTKVLYEYNNVEPKTCNNEHIIYPKPFEACNYYVGENSITDKFPLFITTEDYKKVLRRLAKQQEDFLYKSATNSSFDILKEAAEFKFRPK